MRTRFGNKGIAAVLLAMLILVPASASYAEKQEENDQRVEKLIELAERAKDKTQILINMTYLNTTAIQAIINVGLSGELEDNVTLFNEAAYNITNPDYHNVGNLTLALGVFRDVYKSINRILAATPGVQKGQLVDRQGLIQAMTRALDRIERLEEIENLPDATKWILGNATLYLNVTRAIELLQVGMAEEVTYNKTQANKLISLAHSTLQKKAAELKTQRIRSFFKVIENLYNRLDRQVDKLEDGGDLKTMLGTASGHIEIARSAEDEQALGELVAARNILEEVEQGLKEQRRAGKGNGNGNG